MQLNIIAPNKIIYQGKISSVTLPGKKGELTVLPNHIPLITSLTEGKIKVKVKGDNQKELLFEIKEGILEVKPNEVNLLISQS